MSDSFRTDPYAIRAARRTRGHVPIRVTAPRPGYCHPASPADLRLVLDELGPIATYGVRSIELRQAVLDWTHLLYGQIRYPGLIILFEQPDWMTKELSGMPMREFMMQTLVHEIGHHVRQHRSGKRYRQKLRAVDAEHTAELFVRRHPIGG